MAIMDVQDPLKGSWWCVDATRAFQTLGRLINHSFTPNLKGKAARVCGKLRVAFLALRDIESGEELSYDYGVQRTSEPWLQR